MRSNRRHSGACGRSRRNRHGSGWMLLASLLLAALPPTSRAQVESESTADSVSQSPTAPFSGPVLPDAEERPSFELPEVVVRGEDLSVIAGGERLESDVPALNVSPTERPKSPPPPGLGSPWRRSRPFSLHPTQPVARMGSPAWWRVGLRSEPGIFGSVATGDPGSSAWRVRAAGEWVEDPVPETSRQRVAARFDRGWGHWSSSPHWGLNIEGALRRLDWDLAGLTAEGRQTFFGARGSLWRWWRGSRGGIRVEAGEFRPFRKAHASRWSAAEVQWETGSKTQHPFFWVPGISVRAHGMLGDEPGSSGIRRTWGLIHIGAPVSRNGSFLLWAGAQGSWDENRGLIGPRLLIRWGDLARRVALWMRLETRHTVDSWWDEAKGRDYVLLNLDRSGTGEAPSITAGADIERGRWIVRAQASVRRLRSPRTWREDSGSGLFRPFSTSGRWVGDAGLRISSPSMRPVRLELEAGFFEDGGGDELTFRPAVWGKATLWARAGDYSGSLELDGRGRVWEDASQRLPGFLVLHVEVGRFFGEMGRAWIRVQNVTDDPARVWPFVDGSRRSVQVGWDFVPSELHDSF